MSVLKKMSLGFLPLKICARIFLLLISLKIYERKKEKEGCFTLIFSGSTNTYPVKMSTL